MVITCIVCALSSMVAASKGKKKVALTLGALFILLTFVIPEARAAMTEVLRSLPSQQFPPALKL